ncbi:MAG: phage integrase family protein [Rhodobacteraceae bacterium]|nr:MAG: phage integrase family protein [Paracoccaceae bacterium]
MVKAKPKRYLWQHKGRWYFRKGGKYTPIEAELGTAAFDAAYWAIMAGKGPVGRTNWAALIASYRASDRFTNLRTVTRNDYQRVMDYLLQKNADKDMTRLKRSDVLAAMEANKDRVRFANYIPQVMSVLCEHAIDLGWLATNPAKGVRRIKTPEHKKRTHVPWTDEAVAKFRAEATALPSLIFELGVGTVQRPADLTRFKWGDYDGDTLRLVQSKTGVALMLPCTEALRATLDRVKPDPCNPADTILRNAYGMPMQYHNMSAIMRAERHRLGLFEHDLHAMRYRGVMELAWAGCSDSEIAAYSGHASLAMVRKYAGEARQIMQARAARLKRA